MKAIKEAKPSVKKGTGNIFESLLSPTKKTEKLFKPIKTLFTQYFSQRANQHVDLVIHKNFNLNRASTTMITEKESQSPKKPRKNTNATSEKDNPTKKRINTNTSLENDSPKKKRINTNATSEKDSPTKQRRNTNLTSEKDSPTKKTQNKLFNL